MLWLLYCKYFLSDPAFLYNASVAIARLKLSRLVEPFAGDELIWLS